MMSSLSSSDNNDTPQWKRDLIARLRSQNKRTVVIGRQQQQLSPSAASHQQQQLDSSAAVGRASAAQQPGAHRSGLGVVVVAVAVAVGEPVPVASPPAAQPTWNSGSGVNRAKMVQERVRVNCGKRRDLVGEAFIDCDAAKSPPLSTSDSDSSEDLHYGPGIVNKLKNKYLSLALRESNTKGRMSILPMRKAASLENILNDGGEDGAAAEGAALAGRRLYKPSKLNGNNDISRNAPNRYRSAARGSDLKRARSVETISSSTATAVTPLCDALPHSKCKRDSLNEEALIIATKEGYDKWKTTDNRKLEITEPNTHNNSNGLVGVRINRPKRIAPIMSEKEKPPADFVKHAKLIFEKRPEQRTKAPQTTGKVAAKVATYKTIIGQAKAAKKPPLKLKPITGLKAAKFIKPANDDERHIGHKIMENSHTNGRNVVLEKKPNMCHPNEDSTKNMRNGIDGKMKTQLRNSNQQNYVKNGKTPEDPKCCRRELNVKSQNAAQIKSCNDEVKNKLKNGDSTNIADEYQIKSKIDQSKPYTEKDEPSKNKRVEKRESIIETLPNKSINNNGKSKMETIPNLPISTQYPDVSQTTTNSNGFISTSLSDTPDLLMLSSPVASVSFQKNETRNFIQQEILHSLQAKIPLPTSSSSSSSSLVNLPSEFKQVQASKLERCLVDGRETCGSEHIATDIFSKINSTSNTIIFNFCKSNNTNINESNLASNLSNNQLESCEKSKNPLNDDKEITTTNKKSCRNTKNNNNNSTSLPLALSSSGTNLTIVEIEKNLINTAKTLEQPTTLPKAISVNCIEEVIKLPLTKIKCKPRQSESNTIVFKFTDRKDIPDYLQNDGVRHVSKLEKPKIGEGGITLLPGASIDESFTDEDDEILKSLEAPPSPCDVIFINDNILIDGKSSLNQKTKRTKLRISFVESCPEIYEYPSESSLLIEEIQQTISPINNNVQLCHTVPSLSGTSSLANYTPKSTEEFEPGVTRSIMQNNSFDKVDNEDNNSALNGLLLKEIESPIVFSAGTNPDILF